jgi:hypothetical protein
LARAADTGQRPEGTQRAIRIGWTRGAVTPSPLAHGPRRTIGPRITRPLGQRALVSINAFSLAAERLVARIGHARISGTPWSTRAIAGGCGVSVTVHAVPPAIAVVRELAQHAASTAVGAGAEVDADPCAAQALARAGVQKA